ncbi:glutamic acid-rich protein-like, partial [Homalodisca vitripennis]|uniref:glutamic acid-rich protein-like n=1 Tax=Homalodisca vitripennis TaxID=197043 RepID=UPI001EECB1BF
MKENTSTKKDDDVCKGDNLTPRKIDRFLREPNEDDSDVDLSGESEVFDSDRDPEYHLSVDSDYSDTRKPPFSGLFERQGDQDNVAGQLQLERMKVTENETEQDKDEIDKTGDTREEENKEKENYCEKDEDNNGDDDFDEDDEEENYQESQTEGKGKNKEKKRKKTAREHEYKLTVFGTETSLH